MAKSPVQGSLGSVPSQLPHTTPEAYHPSTSDHGLSFQATMEMHKSIGQLTQAVATLTEESKKNSEILSKVSHKVYATQVTIWVVGGLITVLCGAIFTLFCKIWDAIYPFIQLKPHH